MSPSMLKTPSVAMSRVRASFAAFSWASQIVHVGVAVAVALGLAEPDAVDDGGVVEGVADDRVLLVQQGLEQAAIGVEAGGIEDGILGAEEAGDARPPAPCADPGCRR